MTSEVTEGQIPDVYGQVHPTESDELLVTKLRDLEAELGLIPTADKADWMQAMAKCPELVADDSKLKFLRCEVFNADVSTGMPYSIVPPLQNNNTICALTVTT